MTINLLQLLLSVICTGIQIVLFFLLVRMILMWRSIKWLQAFDMTGNSLVEFTDSLVDRSVYRLWQKHLTPKRRLLLAFCLLELCRTLLIHLSQTM